MHLNPCQYPRQSEASKTHNAPTACLRCILTRTTVAEHRTVNGLDENSVKRLTMMKFVNGRVSQHRHRLKSPTTALGCRAMSTDSSKLRSKLTKLGKSLDELESQLEPLFSKSLPETLLALDTIQQAKLQVIIPYVVYDLVFGERAPTEQTFQTLTCSLVYLKSRGIDPKTLRHC